MDHHGVEPSPGTFALKLWCSRNGCQRKGAGWLKNSLSPSPPGVPHVRPAFVGRLSVTVGFVLTLASAVGLVLVLGHLARSLGVETMLQEVSEEARASYAREWQGREDTAAR